MTTTEWPTLKHDRCIGTDQESASTGATYGACIAFRIHGNIASKHNGIPTIPRATLDPVDSIKKSSSRAVAGVFGIEPFNVMVARRSEKIHKDGLDGLGLVNDSFGADLKTSNGSGVNVVLAHQAGNNWIIKT
jgi:hypothetical protein